MVLGPGTKLHDDQERQRDRRKSAGYSRVLELNDMLSGEGWDLHYTGDENVYFHRGKRGICAIVRPLAAHACIVVEDFVRRPYLARRQEIKGAIRASDSALNSPRIICSSEDEDI